MNKYRVRTLGTVGQCPSSPCDAAGVLRLVIEPVCGGCLYRIRYERIAKISLTCVSRRRNINVFAGGTGICFSFNGKTNIVILVIACVSMGWIWTIPVSAVSKVPYPVQHGICPWTVRKGHGPVLNTIGKISDTTDRCTIPYIDKFTKRWFYSWIDN